MKQKEGVIRKKNCDDIKLHGTPDSCVLRSIEVYGRRPSYLYAVVYMEKIVAKNEKALYGPSIKSYQHFFVLYVEFKKNTVQV